MSPNHLSTVISRLCNGLTFECCLLNDTYSKKIIERFALVIIERSVNWMLDAVKRLPNRFERGPLDFTAFFLFHSWQSINKNGTVVAFQLARTCVNTHGSADRLHERNQKLSCFLTHANGLSTNTILLNPSASIFRFNSIVVIVVCEIGKLKARIGSIQHNYMQAIR